MTHTLGRAILVSLLAVAPSLAQAECYADYRAKMDNPLRLHYGVIELDPSPCTVEAAAPQIAARIAAGGWEMLQVISVFDAAGLNTRRSDAGAYFLRF